MTQDGIRVIRKGTKPTAKLARFTCSHCNTFMEAPASAGQRNSDPVNHESWISFNCPTCGAVQNVATSEFKYKTKYYEPSTEDYYNK